MNPGPNLTLGSSYGYELDRIAPFLDSCRKMIPSAEVVLFSKPTTSQQKEEILELCPTASFHTPSDHEIREKLQQLPRGGRLLSLLNLFLSRGSGKLPFPDPFPPRLTSAFHVAVARYFWYSDYIRNLDQVPGRILLTDTRDVVFQSDPFPRDTGHDLVCGLEPINIGAYVVNRE